MHGVFDGEKIDREDAGAARWGFVVTSAHRESLDEALFAAFPANVWAESVLVVSDRRWAGTPEKRLLDPEQLDRDLESE